MFQEDSEETEYTGGSGNGDDLEDMPDEDMDDELYDEDEEFENSDIINYLFYICSYLLETDYQCIDREEVLASLEMMQDELVLVRTEYDNPAPFGGDGARETVVEIVETLSESVSVLIRFLEEQDDDHIEAGVELLEQADEMIDILKETIAQQRIELAELLSKLKRGDLNEGEPVTNENSSYFYTDEDMKRFTRSVPEGDAELHPLP